MSSQARLQLTVGQRSHPGRKRSNNEDWLGTFQPLDDERQAAKGHLFLVADGMGGHQSGELASRLAVDRVIRHYVDDRASEVSASLRRAIEAANKALYAGSERNDRQTGGRDWGTTLVGAVLRGDELLVANVGDSRAYLLRNGTLRQISHDHAFFLEGAGVAGDWVGRHVITRALGRKPEIEVDLYSPIKVRDGDRLLLCSDGLTTPLSDSDILDHARRGSAQEAADRLVQAANERGGPDNISVMIVQVTVPQPSSLWESLRDWGALLVRRDTWQEAGIVFVRMLPGGEQGPRSPLFIAGVAALILVLIGLGFLVGTILF